MSGVGVFALANHIPLEMSTIGALAVVFPQSCLSSKCSRVMLHWHCFVGHLSLLLWMLTSYFGMGRYIVLDSGLCVLKAIIELKWNGLLGCDKKEEILMADTGTRDAVMQ